MSRPDRQLLLGLLVFAVFFGGLSWLAHLLTHRT